MLELSRTVRFCLNANGDLAGPRHNTYAGWPPPSGLGRYFELTVTCRGEADPKTGYFINIKHIDTAVRDHVLPVLRDTAEKESVEGPTPLGGLMFRLRDTLVQALSQAVDSVELRLTPFAAIAVADDKDPDMPRVQLKQRYEFSAAHRLHVPTLSDEENRAIFGKCNNPAGHGHNYTLEVVANCPVDALGRTIEIAELDAVVNQHAIQTLDHKNLNEDVTAFSERNPSVEHISAVIWDMLTDRLPGDATLAEISVWETGKTVCTFRGPCD